MPIFFFDVRLDGRLIKDEEGIDLSSSYSAIEEALTAADELMTDLSQHPQEIDYGRIEIVDASRKTLMIVPLPIFRLEPSIEDREIRSNFATELLKLRSSV